MHPDANGEPASRNPVVYIVIINWNQAALTGACLESLEKQDYQPFRVVLVDNGSSDDSVQVLKKRFPWVEMIETGENIGYSPGNNAGLAAAMQAGADYILLLNNDTEVHPQMLSHLVEYMEQNPAVGVIGPSQLYADPNDLLWGGANYFNWRQARCIRQKMGQKIALENLAQAPAQQVDYIDTCATLVRRSVIEKIGLMDGRYFINYDDADWSWRAKQAGFQIMYYPKAVMWHKVSATMGQASPRTTYYMTRNELIFFSQNAPGIWRWIAPLRILTRTLRTISAWTLFSRYQTPNYQRRRTANLMALRDFILRRYGKMGPDVEKAISG